MAKTQRELINRVLNDLSAIGNGEDAEVEDFQDIEQRLETLVAELNVRQILNLSTTTNIPEELFEVLVEYVKAKAGPGYGKPDPDIVTVSGLEDRMREISWPDVGRRTMNTDAVLRQGAFFSSTFPFVRHNQ